MCTKNEALLSDCCQKLRTRSEKTKKIGAVAGAKAPLGHNKFRNAVRIKVICFKVSYNEKKIRAPFVIPH
jgi:hypothetical protein